MAATTIGGWGASSAAAKSKKSVDPRQEPLAEFRYDPDYINTPFAGYELYYRSVMGEMGWLISTQEQKKIDTYLEKGGGSRDGQDKSNKSHIEVTSTYNESLDGRETPLPSGAAVSDAFQDIIAESRFVQEGYFDHPQLDTIAVPRDVLLDLADRCCLCQLRHPQAPDRPLLLAGFTQGDEKRKQTFQLLLDIAQQTADTPLTENRFRLLIYFQAAEETGETLGLTYHPHPQLRPIYRDWRLYQAREYYSLALTSLLEALCLWGKNNQGCVRPLPLADWWPAVDRFLANISSYWETENPEQPEIMIDGETPWPQFLDHLHQLLGRPDPSLDAPYDINRPLTEQRLTDHLTDRFASPERLVAAGISMLGLLTVRFAPLITADSEAVGLEMAEKGGHERLAQSSFLRQMGRFQENGASLAAVCRWLYDHCVINQHLAVALGKIDSNNTFRFFREGDSLYFSGLTNERGMNNSRFYALSTHIYDLYLLERPLSEAEHTLTDSGRALLQALEEQP